MKILVVCSRSNGMVSPFIVDQVESIIKLGIETNYFFIDGKGISGYLKAYFGLLKKIKSFKPDIVHAHYGLSGLLSTFQRSIPVVITFHGCDVNVLSNRRLSKIASNLCCKSIYVSKDLAILNNQKKPIVIPCGVDLNVFCPTDKTIARNKFNLSLKKKYILFSSAFDNQVKNFKLANESLSILNNPNVEILELKGYNREEVATLMNAVDMVLMTSLREGSPQFIKEALACNTPIVSVDVGDVKDLISGVEGNILVENKPKSIARAIEQMLESNTKTLGRKKMLDFENMEIAKRIKEIYYSCINS